MLKMGNNWQIGGGFKIRNRGITFLFILNISNTSRLDLPSIALMNKKL